MNSAPLSAPYALTYSYKRSLGPVLSAFFSALHRRTILGARTANGDVLCPPQEFDPKTGDATGELVEVGPAGTVTAWAWVDTPRPQHPLQHPFAFALILLDGATTSMLHIVDCEAPEAIGYGCRVWPRWSEQPVGGIRDLDAFVTAPTAQAPSTQAPSTGEEAEITRLKTPIHLDYSIRAGVTQTQFLTALMDRKLLGSLDPVTGEVYVPMRTSSPVHGGRCTEIVEVQQTGTVSTFCVVRIPFEGQRIKPPYVCAQVLLDGADTPLFHLVGGCSVDDVHIGMRVQAEWVDDDELAPTLESIKWFAPLQSEPVSGDTADA